MDTKGIAIVDLQIKYFLYTDFKQIKAVYDFDMKIKSIFYPQIMFLETTIKNYSLEIILNEVNSDRFVDVYTKLMNNYKSYPFNSKKYKIAITKKNVHAQ